MIKFDYVRAVSLDHAVGLINDPAHISKLLAGGTDLQVLLHHLSPVFDRVVDISLLPELKVIQRRGDKISLGAGVTYAEAIESKLIQDSAPFLVEACHSVGSPQIRNLGTLGGNVVNAAACADSIPVLVCLEAVAHLCGSRGERAVRMSDLILGPNCTQVEAGEILTDITFQIPHLGVKTSFIKLGRRNALAISRLTMATMGRLDAGGRVDFIRITPGAATPQTFRFTQIENLLLGQAPSLELIRDAAQQVADVMTVSAGRRWSSEYKRPVISTLAERGLNQVLSLL